MGKLKVGIAGYGVVGKRRRNAIDQHPALETAAVCDRIFQENGSSKTVFVFIQTIRTS